jgi:Ca2+-binding RTX toxin-like protein
VYQSPRRRGCALAIIASALALLAFAPGAFAATLGVDGSGNLVYAGTASTVSAVEFDETDTNEVTVHEITQGGSMNFGFDTLGPFTDNDPINAGTNCTASINNDGNGNPVFVCTGVTGSVQATTLDGNDAIDGSGQLSGEGVGLATIPLVADLGADDDAVIGGRADDTIHGGDGVDNVQGDTGGPGGGSNDTLFGDAGDDNYVAGGSGTDNIDGGAGDDSNLVGGPGPDTITGGDGNDSVAGGPGPDTLDGGAGDDSVYGDCGGGPCSGGGSPGADTVNGGDGNDDVHGDEGDDIVNGGAGNDSADGDDGNDTVNGNAGNDTVSGENGNDVVDGGDDNDAVYGDSGDDTVRGGAGTDDVHGEDGNDVVDAGAGDDGDVGGGPGADTVSGGDGNDRQVFGGPGNDTVDGGAGDDFVSGDCGSYGRCDSGADGNDVVRGGPGEDYVGADGGADSIDMGSGIDEIDYPDRIEVCNPGCNDTTWPVTVTLDGVANDGGPNEGDNVVGTEDVYVYDNFLCCGDQVAPGDAHLTGDAGVNTLTGAGGNDTIDGGAGNDFLYGNDGNDTMNANDGFADRVVCGPGTDVANVDEFDQVADDCETVNRTTRGHLASEDAPPTVAFTAPASGAKMSTSAANTLSVTATDDKGISQVIFLANERVICVVKTAPYNCSYKPTDADVGRTAITAVAYDTSQQTASAIRSVTVPRFTLKSISFKTKPGKDTTAPFKFKTSGKINLPSGVTKANGCKGDVIVTFKAGKKTISARRAKVSKSCTFSKKVTFSLPSRLHPKTLRVHVAFRGNAVVSPKGSKTKKVKVA